jgi:hypothetical protein
MLVLRRSDWVDDVDAKLYTLKLAHEKSGGERHAVRAKGRTV